MMLLIMILMVVMLMSLLSLMIVIVSRISNALFAAVLQGGVGIKPRLRRKCVAREFQMSHLDHSSRMFENIGRAS